MQQYQQIPQNQPNDAQLFQIWQTQEFQKWKQSRFPYRNQNEPQEGSSTWKWVFGIFLIVVVGVVSFLLVKNKGKIVKPVFRKQNEDNQEATAEESQPPSGKTLNGKKPKMFTKLQQHQQFRDKALADLQKQSIGEFTAWLTAEQGFEKISDDFYQNERLAVEVKMMKQGINIYAGASDEPVFRPYTEVEALDFREKFLSLIAE